MLDGLSVDEVMKLVGVRRGSSERAAGARGEAGRARAAGAESSDDTAVAGADDALPMPTDAVSPPPAAVPPPEPERRFAAGASTDWREALRNAGAARPADEGPARNAGPGTPRSPATTAPTAGAPGASPASTPTAPATSPAAALPSWLAALDVPAGLEAGRVRLAEIAPDVSVVPTLDELAERVAGCTSCALYRTAKHPVPGEGNPQAEFLCVGEAPGAMEDEQGRPFIGEAGQLLTKILGAIQLTREEVFICNVLKHRPPGNRDPLPDEVLACQPYLLRQIELVRPKVILALGRFAAQTLLQTTAGIGALRGQIHQYHGVPLIVTYHPAALLRNEQWKRPTWEDVKLARRVLDAARAAQRGTE